MLSREYQNTAYALRRVAQNMTDQSIAGRVEALAKDYERRAEKALLKNDEKRERRRRE
jgi:uncharacterized protein YeeX (DUF496 family)